MKMQTDIKTAEEAEEIVMEKLTEGGTEQLDNFNVSHREYHTQNTEEVPDGN